MYQVRSSLALRRGGYAELRHELDRLREENEILQRFKSAAQPVLAELALNPFAEIDDLRRTARAALPLARRLASVAAKF